MICKYRFFFFFFFYVPATTEIYTLSLHDALPIYIELVHQTTLKQPFLNYTWLLATVLRISDLARYCVYVKKLKCKKRIKSYEQDFAVILKKLDRSDRYGAVPGYALRSRTQPSE